MFKPPSRSRSRPIRSSKRSLEVLRSQESLEEHCREVCEELKVSPVGVSGPIPHLFLIFSHGFG